MIKLKAYANWFWNLLSPIARASLISFLVGLLVGWAAF